MVRPSKAPPMCGWRRLLHGSRTCSAKANWVFTGLVTALMAMSLGWEGAQGRTSRVAGSLSYERRGTGPGILFVHGFGGNRTVWKDIASRLDRDHTTVCVDLPGSGDSPPPPERSGSADFETIAGQLTSTVEELGIQPCIIVGHSMGGSLAALAVLRKPSDFRGLVIVDQSLCPSQPLSASLWTMALDNPRAFLATFLAPGARTIAEAHRVVDEALELQPSVRSSYLKHLGLDDLRGRRNTFNLPVALFTQSAPLPGSTSYRPWLKQRGFGEISSLLVERFPGDGHWIMWDDPETFVARLRTIEHSF